MPDGFTCDKCGGTAFERERDILDVWFDSGSSHEAVLAQPAGAHVAGGHVSRRHRSVSRLVSVVAARRRRHARPRAVSRSRSRTASSSTSRAARCRSRWATSIVPQQVIKDSGAEVLRLWVSMVDYRDEVRLGKAVLARTVEAYRKIRNTFRYLLVEPVRLRSGARRGAGRAAAGGRSIRAGARTRGSRRSPSRAYEAYDFQAIFHAINEFVTVDLSAFYVDVSKDRLYTFRADSRRAPVGADGAVRHRGRPGAAAGADPVDDGRRDLAAACPARARTSVHLAEFPRGRRRVARCRPRSALDAAARAADRRQRRARSGASREDDRQRLDGARHAPRGAGRSAGGPARGAQATTCRCCSSSRRSTSCAGSGALAIEVAHAPGDKCPRCWRFVTETMTSRRARAGCACVAPTRWETRLLPRTDDPAVVAPPRPAGRRDAGGAPRGLASFRIYWWLSAVDRWSSTRSRRRSCERRCRSTTAGRSSRASSISIHVHNEGVAFGLLNDANLPFKGWLTTALAALALVGIGFYARHVRPEERLARIGLSLILGGAIGNLDRPRPPGLRHRFRGRVLARLAFLGVQCRRRVRSRSARFWSSSICFS